jgi:inner membrane protein
MDVLTHGLASYSVTRAAFPRASRAALLAAILAGAVADVDYFSANAGPSAFLAWHRTATHSILGTLGIVATFAAVVWLMTRNKPQADSIGTVSLAMLAACSLHVAMDLAQNESVQLLWPFRTQRYSADWVARFDLWILLLFLAGALLPQLLALVTEEIGAKSKAPRGRIGAILALLAVFIYIGVRFVLHGNAVAMMDARTYRGELPRRVAAFADSDSPLHWRGIVETERAFHDLDLNVARSSSFNPDAAVVYYKPESSAPLGAARNTESVRRFLEAAKFPKATVEKTNSGYRVQLRDLAQQRETLSGTRVVAIVETDQNAKVLSDELAWNEKK